VTRIRTALAGIPEGVLIALAAVLAAVLAWRIVVAGVDAQRRRDDATLAEAVRRPAGTPGADVALRQRLVRDPADAATMLALALQLEQQGSREDADAAMTEALRLAPADLHTLLPAAEYYLRAGKDREALAAMRRAVDASPSEVPRKLWEVLVAALDSGRYHAFFVDIAREDPPWWSAFFRMATSRAANAAVLDSVFASRASAGVATADEREWMVSRLQRDRQWARAYALWVNGLPPDRQQRIGYVFNGGFELPLTKHGFDWLVSAQPGVTVAAGFKEGMAGQHVLQVAFASTRLVEPPVYQYLVLVPGRYAFEARARTDLESWLGLQWGLYCDDAARAARQLFHTERLLGLADWHTLRAEFAVPADCPAQVLRLELANPRGEARAAEAVPVRFNGRLWFDDVGVRLLDSPQGG